MNNNIGKIVPGIVLNVVIAVIAIYLSKLDALKSLHISSLLFAIIIGAIIANFSKFTSKDIFQPGIKVCGRQILRLGVILLGFKLDINELKKLGVTGVLYIGLLIFLTIIIVKFVAKKVGLAEKMGICLAAGTAICGASAIAAVGPIVEAEEEDTAFGIGAITFFGTIAMFVFPVLYRVLQLNPEFYGSWVGMTLPEVAEVVAAGGAVGSDVANGMALLTKMTRVVYLVPVSLAFTWWQAKRTKSTVTKKIDKPYYVLGFILVVIINSLHIIPKEMVDSIFKVIGAYILTTAMASLGVKTDFKKMISAGLKPLFVGIVGVIVIQILGIIGTYMLFS